MKKVLLFFLAICSFFVANAAPVTTSRVIDGITYTVTVSGSGSIGVATVKSGVNCTGDIEIPSQVVLQTSSVDFVLCPVTGIEANAFKGSSITSVKIPNSVHTIGDCAFFNCSKLKSITVPPFVTSLGVNSLNAGEYIDITINSASLLKGEKNAINLALNGRIGSLTLDADTVIMDYDKSGNLLFSVGELVLGPKVVYVGRMSSITTIDNLVIGKNVDNMTKAYFAEYWQKAIGQSSVISKVTFNGDLTKDIFGGESILEKLGTDVKTVAFAEGVKTISVNYFKNTYTGNPNAGIKEVILPSTLETLKGAAFKGEPNLVNVNIPENLKVIGQEVFAGTGISYFVVPSIIAELDPYSFENCKNLRTIIFEEGVEKVGGFVINGCNNLNHIEIPSTVTVFGTQNKLETKNLTYLKDLSDVSEIYPENMDCTIITNSEARADVYREKGYKNVFSMEVLKYSKADVNRDGEINTKDVKKVYEEIMNQ